MADNQNPSQTDGSCARKCGGCKFLAGVLVGLLVAGTGLGIYLAGRCRSHGMCPMMHGMCPMTGQQTPAPTPSKPGK